jgi:pSer/pThr/pTyr-binding forkhead associated (FHA) protein
MSDESARNLALMEDATAKGAPIPRLRRPAHSVELVFGAMRKTASGTGMVIGRSSNADVQVPDRDVSRRHCRVWRDEADFMVEDLGSTHGTFVNGVRIQVPTRLSLTDLLTVGTVSIDVEDLRLE